MLDDMDNYIMKSDGSYYEASVRGFRVIDYLYLAMHVVSS
jgi:hypothetical protein